MSMHEIHAAVILPDDLASILRALVNARPDWQEALSAVADAYHVSIEDEATTVARLLALPVAGGEWPLIDTRH